MGGFRDWRLGSKLMTLSVVCFLLCVPLCGMGLTIDTSGTKMQQFEFGCGMVLLVLAVVLFFAGIIAFISRSGDK